MMEAAPRRLDSRAQSSVTAADFACSAGGRHSRINHPIHQRVPVACGVDTQFAELLLDLAVEEICTKRTKSTVHLNDQSVPTSASFQQGRSAGFEPFEHLIHLEVEVSGAVKPLPITR